MHDTSTIFGGHIIAEDDFECSFARVCPRNELLVLDTFEVSTLAAPEDFGRFAKFFGVSREACLSEEVEGFDLGIWVLALDDDVVNLWSYAEGSVAWEGPRGSGPRESVERQLRVESRKLRVERLDEELRGAGGVLYVTIATRLVELVG